MKKIRKGFTLVELLIVIAILGALSAMMATSSSESIDASAANAILNNLQTLKTAAFEMYMEDPVAASMQGEFADDTLLDDSTTMGELLGQRLGRKDIPAKYFLFGDAERWYVFYEFDEADSLKVKEKLYAVAERVGLFGQDASSSGAELDNFTDYYDGDTHTIVALKVR